MTIPFDPNTAENNPDIEKQWAVKALDHAETFMRLRDAFRAHSPSGSLDGFKLTRIDEEIYQDFRKEFPDFPVDVVDVEQMKSEAAKAKWRPWINQYEKRVKDFNFGTLLRLRADGDYTEENSVFATRMQFYAIEIARVKEGY